MSQWIVLLIGFAVLVAIGYLLRQIVTFLFWFWRVVQHSSRGIAYNVACAMGRLLRRDQGNVVIASWQRVVTSSVIVVVSIGLISWLLRGPALLLVSLWMMVVAVLVLLSKVIMLQEDSQILNGILLEEHARFRDLQGAIPTSILFVAVTTLFMSFVFALVAFDTIFPGALFTHHSPATIVDWLISITMQFDTIKSMVKMLSIPNLQILQPTPMGQAFFNIAIPLLFSVLLYGVIAMQYRHLQIVDQILEALRRDDANIPFIQRRAALAPTSIKRKLIDMALNDPDAKVRRRAMSVARHAPIFSFPQAFIANLHQEQNSDLKDWGLKICRELLQEYMTGYEYAKRSGILQCVRYQRYKKQHVHNAKTQQVLEEIEQIIQPHIPPPMRKALWQRKNKKPPKIF